jgi:hypothetical protein
MAPPLSADELDNLKSAAYDAFDDGNLSAAAENFNKLTQLEPDNPTHHYMHGLAAKYLMDWSASLESNLRSQALSTEPDEASIWNAGIAATGLGNWSEARRQWARCGIELPASDGPIEANFGTVSIRLNPWGDGETLYAHRIDPVRARLWNIPLPESGYQYGDIVLHDGASTGSRLVEGKAVPVFNALQRLERSEFKTFTAFVTCNDADSLSSLLDSRAPGLGAIEDWTASISSLCLRCSYGSPHEHDNKPKEKAWEPDRQVGFAAQSKHVVEKVLGRWQRWHLKRKVTGIEYKEFPPILPQKGSKWWVSPKIESGGP